MFLCQESFALREVFKAYTLTNMTTKLTAQGRGTAGFFSPRRFKLNVYERMPKVPVSFRYPPEDLELLRALARHRRISLSRLLAEAADHLLEGYR